MERHRALTASQQLSDTLVLMREDRRDPIDQCEVVEARHVEDSIGYLCERTAKQECDDCGAAICDLHANFAPSAAGSSACRACSST